MENFKCSDCGFIISVDFHEDETQRNVPCGKCYYESYEYNAELQETIKHEHGSLILCEKGKGI